MPKIISFESFDVRFPTSKMLDGSDAMNADPDYSAAYIRLKTDGLITGDSLVFTIGRGNEIQIAAINILAEKIIGLDLDEAFTNIGAIAKELSSDSQLRWLGPDMGVFHMAAGAVLNALWDLFSKNKGVPLWKILSDMSSEEIVGAIDFRYISDALTPDEALEILNRAEANKAKNEAILLRVGLVIAMKKCLI